MANMCKAMTEKPNPGRMLYLLGIVFMALGAVVLIEPAVLAWLAAIVLIMMGIGMLAFARFMRRARETWHHMHG
jgi:uncharacterized membrane protein HdeD (DUF308 family)